MPASTMFSDDFSKKISEAFIKGLRDGIKTIPPSSIDSEPKYTLTRKRIILEQLWCLGYEYEHHTKGQDKYIYTVIPTTRKEFEGYPIPRVQYQKVEFQYLHQVQTWIDEIAQMRREEAAERGKITLYDKMHGVEGEL